MKRIFLIVICAAAALILGYGIRHAVAPLASQPLEKTTYEQSVPANGFIIRDESIYYAGSDGRVYSNASVGSRVSKNSLIYTIYDSSVSNSVIQELGIIDSKIKNASDTSSGSYISDTSSVESEISSLIKAAAEAARNRDVIQISQYKKDINDIRANGRVTSSAEQIDALKAQRESTEGEYAYTKTEVYAQSSGIYTAYHDGFEDKIDINNLDNCTVDYIKSLEAPENIKNDGNLVSEGDFVCSIVNNHLWYAILTVETDEIEKCKTGDTVSVRFTNIADEVEEGTIIYISGEAQNSGGESFVLVEFSNFFDGAFSYRAAETELIFESYTGYKIPSQAIHTQEDGSHTIIALKDNKQYTCEVDVLYSNTKEGYVIVAASDGAENKPENMDTIIIGER